MKNLKMIVVTLLFLKSIVTFSQTIDYAYKPLDVTSCNVFASKTTVDNYEHLTSIRGPIYNDNSIKLASKNITTTSILSTQYSIKYNFKVGYNYKISVYYKGEKDPADNYYPQFGLKISLTDGGTDATLDCTNPAPISAISSFTTGAAGSNYAWATNFLNITITQNANYLLVGGFPWAGTTKTGNVWIRKIQIIETPPAPSFTLTPASTLITCGSVTPITFTVNNVNNTTGITDYSWNLGATPNGWLLPNGNPAPQTYSTGIVNTLTLTPVCGASQGNISAYVIANSTTYNTNTSAISITQPSISISGNSTLCSGSAVYSVIGLPCNSTVTWDAPPTGLGTLSNITGSPTTLTYGGSSGKINLTANVTACGSPYSYIKPIIVGTPATLCEEIGNGICTQTNFLCPSQLGQWKYINLVGTWGAGGTKYFLQTSNGAYFNNGQTTQEITTNYFSVFVPSGGTSIIVRAMNDCGVNTNTPYVIVYALKGYGCSGGYSVTPNPASSTITVAPAEGNSSAQNSTAAQSFNEIQIVDKLGNLKKKLNFANGINRTSIDISSLSTDTYIVRINSGGSWEEYKIIVVK